MRREEAASLRRRLQAFGLDAVNVYVTSYGTVRLTNDAVRELTDLCGVQWLRLRPDMRTKQGKLARQIFAEIEHLAMLEWIKGRYLDEL